VRPVVANRNRSTTLYSSASLERRRPEPPSTHSVPLCGIGACDLTSNITFCREVLV
jgi:hypothetical protein